MKKTGGIIFMLLAAVLFSTAIMASQVRVTWNPNTEPDLAGYNVYWVLGAGEFQVPPITVPVSPSPETLITFEEPEYGTNFRVVVTAFDTSENESGFSSEGKVFIRDENAPGQVQGVIATIIEQVVKFFRWIFGMNTVNVELIS